MQVPLCEIFLCICLSITCEYAETRSARENKSFVQIQFGLTVHLFIC